MSKPIELMEALQRGQTEGFREPGDSLAADCIAGLVDRDLQELRAKDSLTGFSDREIYTFETVNEDRTGFDIFMAELTFVYPEDLTGDLLNHKPLSLEAFMARAYVAEYDSQHDTLTLISSDPLTELLPRHASHFGSSVPPLDAVLDEYDAPPLNRANYSGQHYICDYPGVPGVFCGEPMCRSSYCWIKDNLCLIYLVFAGGDWLKIDFYPFHTRLDAAGMEKVRAASTPRYLREQP